MRHGILMAASVIICLCGIARYGWARSDLAAAVDSAYEQGQYERVELLVLRSAQSVDSIPAAEQVDVYLKTGFAMVMMNRENDARAYFIRALDVNPTTQLDPVRISPVFRSVFDEVKAAYRPRTTDNSQNSLVHNAFVRKPRTTLANLALPGSGQWMEGRRVRGVVTAGMQLLTAGFFIAQMDQLHQSRERYIHMTDRSQVSAAYDSYYDEYRKAWIAGIIAGAVYLGSQVDLALSSPPVRKPDQPSASIDCYPTANGARCRISVRW